MAALDVIYVKTSKGEEEIQNRAHHLPARIRALLFMIDGVRPAFEWIEKAALLGGGEEWLQQLVSQGFIRDSHGSGTHPAAVKQAAAPLEKKPVAAPPIRAAQPTRAAPSTPAPPSADQTKRLADAKSIMRYCVRNCTGFGDSRALNKILDQAHDKDELLDCLNAIAEKLDNGPQAAMVSKMREQVLALLQ